MLTKEVTPFDALSVLAIESLPYLTKQFQQLLGIAPGERKPDETLGLKVRETLNLLESLSTWFDGESQGVVPPPSKDTEMDDGEAIQLLAMMDEPVEMSDEEVPAEKTENTAEETFEEIDEWENSDFTDDLDMRDDFIVNSNELMESLDEAILRLEQTPQDRETIEEIFRAAHTLKGASGMFGFKAIERIVHRMENLFDLIRKNELKPTSNMIDVVFYATDTLKIFIAAVKDGKPCGKKTVPIVEALVAASKGKTCQISAKTPEDSQGTQEGAKTQEPTKNKSEQSTIRVDLARLDMLVNLIGELVIDRTRFLSIEERMHTDYPALKINAYMTETVQLFGRHMNQIQEIIMKIRMVPIGNAFHKFVRIIRDLSRSLDKKIHLEIFGEATELDKTIVEKISDPLIHLIRNSCDHGIEMPEEREKFAKPPSGRIVLGARQEGNHIVITIADDGKGMDVEKIRQKGVERGLVQPEEKLSSHEIFQLIFESGFSTAEAVTNVSGRGVGMDVVKKQITQLKGSIDVQSQVGEGTTITIQLPLTLAIMQSLLVKLNQEVFAIPLNSVVKSIRIEPDNIKKVGDTEVIRLRDDVLPLLHLDEVLDLKEKENRFWYDLGSVKKQEKKSKQGSRNTYNRLYVVVVAIGSKDRRFGIVVDALLNQQEMVIKSIGQIMQDTPCVAGGAVLGNGEIVLVLDMLEVEEQFKLNRRRYSLSAKESVTL